ncbi:MAG: alanine racemase [Mariprofundaceae bacterium]
MSRPAIARINLDHLTHNYRLLKQRAGCADIMAVVKANAYGHGLNLVAPALFDAGCTSFAVTDAKEAVCLCDYLHDESDIRITLLSGIYDASDAGLCTRYGFIPAISEMEHIRLLQDAGFHGSVWIKVDTGMNRIGALHAAELIARLERANMQLAGIMSHLACADTPEHPMNQAQFDVFNSLHQALAPHAPASLLNSAGLIGMPEHVFNVVRPGIALYGAEPIASEPIGLKAVMQLTGRIMQLRDISAGEPVSYGASFTASRDTRVAVVSLGYADGVPRELSNRGAVIIHATPCPIIGRVCMDYTLVDVSECACAEADTVEFWGDAMPVNDVAGLLDTISYTLFTGVGERVLRRAGP